MATFYLKSTRNDGTAKLYTRIRRNGMQFILCSGINVDIKEWNKAQKSAYSRSKYETTPEGKKVHDQCQAISEAIDMLFDEGKINTMADREILEKAMSDIVNADAIAKRKAEEEALRVKTLNDRKYVITFYDYFMKGIIDGSIRHGNNKIYTDGSIKAWRDFGRYLKQLCPIDLKFEDITKPFADKFSQNLEREGLLPKTCNKHISSFRKLCNLAAEEGFNNNAVSLRVWKEKTISETDKRAELYLNTEELDALYAMKLTGSREEVRDIFFLGYLSCQRFSDYNNLTRSNFTQTDAGTPVIRLKQVKTGTQVEVPILDERVFEICKKYDYNFPRQKEQYFNTLLRDILKTLSDYVPSLKVKFPTNLSCGERRLEQHYQEWCDRIARGEALDSVYEKRKYAVLHRYAEEHNGSPLYERDAMGHVLRCKYEMITSHTARRSGVTNLYKEGVLDTREMMSISGHQSESVFEEYIKVSRSEQADKIAAKLRAKRQKEKE